MKVWIKSFDVEMQVKSNGLELEVRTPDNTEQLGDCYVTMTGLTWCAGKVSRENGVKLSWNDVMALCSSPQSLKAAIKAAKKAE
jgi:hypothetical protein